MGTNHFRCGPTFLGVRHSFYMCTNIFRCAQIFLGVRQSFRCGPIFAEMKAVMQSQYYPSTKPTLIHPPCSILGCIKGIFCMKEGEGSPPAPSRKVKILFTIFHIWSEFTFEGGWQTRKAGSTKGKLSYLVEIWSQSTNLLKMGRF